MAHKTREGWLLDAVERLDEKVFKPLGHEVPKKIQVSCGFPKGHARAIGQCWDPTVTPDGTTHMFICPTLTDPLRVLDVLTHEMVHAVVGCECGHKGPFKTLARKIGLEGKLTATVVTPKSPLMATLVDIQQTLGEYPHSGMRKPSGRGKKSGGWVRYRSVNIDGYTVVVSPKNVDNYGPPRDPEGDEMEPVS